MKRLLSVFEAKDAVDNGADEVDMVINLGWVKDNRFDLVEEEIRKIKEAVGDKILKVIIETCLLTEEEKIGMCRAVTAAGADYIKTSTGFSKEVFSIVFTTFSLLLLSFFIFNRKSLSFSSNSIKFESFTSRSNSIIFSYSIFASALSFSVPVLFLIYVISVIV